MPFTDYFAVPFESESCAFERLMQKYEPKILKTVSHYARLYNRYLCPADHDDLIQIASFAFFEANQHFDMAKVDHEKNPESVFIAFAAKTMSGRLSDYLRKYYRTTSKDYSVSDTENDYDIPDETHEPINRQMLRLIEDYLPCLSPRQALYLKLTLFDDWDTRQIAASQQVSEHTVRSWKKELRKKLAPLKEELKVRR
ncbi:sigma-70 family RNA polymerase sigma factor [Sporolactobacillus sp. CPB3-1]|uniref:Sigma-70 family RNA polymerase sigma factor n=1 Tax=Sporolactobacillus mangiferae TaxID=2940498 RepID=A0ABT0MDK1_9BACL|nr:sigma-70 family RNA polymerase sigma factor [Sporolactobacillus mangiferae]MCL1632753.1 sigma-70 family RNA polymerase sigma factor [Sporolactobacillus mangiferae]